MRYNNICILNYAKYTTKTAFSNSQDIVALAQHKKNNWFPTLTNKLALYSMKRKNKCPERCDINNNIPTDTEE